MGDTFASQNNASGYNSENDAIAGALKQLNALKDHDPNLKLTAAYGPTSSMEKMNAQPKLNGDSSSERSNASETYANSVWSVGYDTKNDAIAGALVAANAAKKQNKDVTVSANVYKQGDLEHKTKVKLEDKRNED